MIHPDDFCRACKGKGYFTEPGRFYGDPSTTTTCSSCNGAGYFQSGDPDMRTIVITGSVDPELGAKLVEAYGASGLIVPAVQGQYAYGYLHMTNLDPRSLYLAKDVEIIPVEEAIKELVQ